MKKKVTIEVEDGTPLAKLLALIATLPFNHLSVEAIEPDKATRIETPHPPKKPPKHPTKKRQLLLRDRVMAEHAAGLGNGSKGLVLDALKSGPKRKNELGSLMRSYALSEASAYWALGELRKAGLVQDLGDRTFGLVSSPTLVLEAPSTMPSGAAQIESPKAHMTGMDLIKAMAAKGEITQKEVASAFKHNGLRPDSASARLHDAVSRGILTKEGDGAYRLTNNGGIN